VQEAEFKDGNMTIFAMIYSRASDRGAGNVIPIIAGA
jgi:hypothetical protein